MLDNAGGLIQGPQHKWGNMKKVKIKLIRNTGIQGVMRKKGWSGDVHEDEAIHLMRTGKAVLAGKQKK
jgi:hypothetical protein